MESLSNKPNIEYNGFDLHKYLEDNYTDNAYEIEPFVSFDSIDSLDNELYFVQIMSRNVTIHHLSNDVDTHTFNVGISNILVTPYMFAKKVVKGTADLYVIGYKLTFKRKLVVK